MSPLRQATSIAPKKSVSIRFKASDYALVKKAAEIADETFQRFTVQRMLQASSELIEMHRISSRKSSTR
jgi:uncharacterized protein (DUF1778 family)